MSRQQREIADECREWYREEACPLPVDLHLRAEMEGIDTTALEESCLHNQETQ